MVISRPSLRQLECLVALAEHLNFRQAAEASGVSQPALSAQISQLETRLGQKLFERDKRRVLVTPAGRELVERARAALAEIDTLVEAARVLQEPLSGTLRLGVIPTVAPWALPGALSAARERYPRLRLLLREERTADLVALAKKGELDLLLLALEADLADLERLPLYRDPFRVAVPQGHPLALRRTVREEDLRGEEVLLLEDGHCLRDQALSFCRGSGLRELADFRATSLGTLERMVASGVGLTFLPAMAAAELGARDGLATVALPEGAAGRTIGLAWRKSSPRAKEFRALAELFREHAPAGTRPLAAAAKRRASS
jgi:LysR family hydrogen peroxide-inducible transcriptional activator